MSVVPVSHGFRLTCNRDEKRTRAQALAPAAHRAGVLSATWPIDPDSGGTWIGINEAGMAMAVLNRTGARRHHRRSTTTVSRGTIIPSLLAHDCLDRAVKAALDLRPIRFEPFTLLILQGHSMSIVTSDGDDVVARSREFRRPFVLVSSALGDHRVAPRRALFFQLMRHHTIPLTAQQAFHRHRWPARPDISVCMSRADASTVSRTAVDVVLKSVAMRYEAIVGL